MNEHIHILIIITLVVLFLFFINKFNNKTEHFLAPKNVGARRHPDQDIVNTAFNGPDPETLRKLKQTILTDKSRTSKTQVAYNDEAKERTGFIRPFNDAGEEISTAQASSGAMLNDQFDNSFYQLWMSDQNRERELINERVDEIRSDPNRCISYNNINQCMSVCGNTEDCVGFYLDGNNKCCMLTEPPYETNRHAYNRLPQNIDTFSQRTYNDLIKRAKLTDEKVVFDKIRTDGGNNTFNVDVSRTECKAMCPKCIVGRCPENYRCTNLTSDPRYNYSCMITNQDEYDETKGRVFDSPNIPYLDEKYGLNEYAGYNPDIFRPVTELPDTYRKDVDGDRSPLSEMSAHPMRMSERELKVHPIENKIIPDKADLRSAFKKFNTDHVGPDSFKKDFGESQLIIAADNIKFDVKKLEGFTSVTDPLYKLSDNIRFINLRGGNDPINLEGFDMWVNRDSYHPEIMSDDAHFIEIRGENDPINLEGHYDHTIGVDDHMKKIYKANIEEFKLMSRDDLFDLYENKQKC